MLAALLRRATWTGVRRGMSGSRVWMIVAVLAVGARALRHLAHSEPEVLYRTRVRPGDIFVVGAKEPS
jgi:hypothetical protein